MSHQDNVPDLPFLFFSPTDDEKERAGDDPRQEFVDVISRERDRATRWNLRSFVVGNITIYDRLYNRSRAISPARDKGPRDGVIAA